MYLKILFLEYLKWVGVLKMYHYMVKPVEKAVFLRNECRKKRMVKPFEIDEIQTR